MSENTIHFYLEKAAPRALLAADWVSRAGGNRCEVVVLCRGGGTGPGFWLYSKGSAGGLGVWVRQPQSVSLEIETRSCP